MGNETEDLQKIKRAFKPSLSVSIYTTIIAIAPFLHLLLDIADRNYERIFNANSTVDFSYRLYHFYLDELLL